MQTEVSKTKMVAGKSEPKVKLQTVRRYTWKGAELSEGQVLEVSHEEAKELLQVSVQGQYDFSGEKDGTAKQPRLYFFKMLREQSPEDELASLQRS